MKPELDDTLAAPQAPQPAAEPRTATATGPGRASIASVAALSPGQQLGHFRIERRLGAGGMGEVYLATDLALDRPVAIKVLPEALAKDQKRRERMIREARAQARVSHPNVGHIYFIGEEAERVFFAMEYVNGKTLGEVLADGPMSVDDALSVIRAAASGLREAQLEGFTHRDVKPSNLMLDGHGMVKVLDFGLAAGDGGVLGHAVAQTSLAGTPLYMAPEQARGDAVDHRADIYALGATLYHLISGKPPFVADSVDELLSMHATSARPSVPRRGIPRTQIGAIDAMIARMMAARPEERFASYDELLRAIELASNAQTRPGGFWVRTIAMVIDSILVSLVLWLAARPVWLLVGSELDDGGLIDVLGLMAYQALATARWGCTIGKGIFELEVVDVVTTQRPSLARSTRRALAMFGLPLFALSLNIVLDMVWITSPDDLDGLFVLVIGLGGLVLLLYAANRVAGKRALWDRSAGTMVRYRTTRTAAK